MSTPGGTSMLPAIFFDGDGTSDTDRLPDQGFTVIGDYGGPVKLTWRPGRMLPPPL